MLEAPQLMLWRAPVDNDGFKLMPHTWSGPGVGGRVLGGWVTAGLDQLGADNFVSCETHHEPSVGGEVHTWKITVPEGVCDLGRVGVRWAIPNRFRMLHWYGRGPGENYPDRNRGSMISRWHREVDPMPYLIPQEYGLRTDTRWMACEDPATGERVWIRALQPAALHIAVLSHCTEELFAAPNAADLKSQDRLWVHVDVAHRGLGTASCGPDVLARYQIPAGVYEFSFWIGVTTGPTGT